VSQYESAAFALEVDNAYDEVQMTKVLIVEDDAVLLGMYSRMFKHDGFEVETAVNGKDGLMKARSFKPDAIVLDIMLPEMTGMQVLDALKAAPDTERALVVVVTNLVSQQDEQQVLGKGAMQVLDKTKTNPKQVVEAIRQELIRRGIEVPAVG
jgi:CheY-like chemotaxis protein